MKIASLLPSATEIICSLGLEDRLVGISHSCDYPASIKKLPVLTRTHVPHQASSLEIDEFVREYLGGHGALYDLDLAALNDAAPDIVVSQRLCDVCAVSSAEVDEAIACMGGGLQMVDLEPSSLDDIFNDILAVGKAAGVSEFASEVVSNLQKRVAAVAARSLTIAPESRPRLGMIEWLNPPFNSGHWCPEVVELAGAIDVLGPRNKPSHTITWQDVADARPDVLLLSVCGFDVQRTLDELALISADPEWCAVHDLVKGNVLVIDGDAYLSRPGPRVVDALEALAHALHPGVHPPPQNDAQVVSVP